MAEKQAVQAESSAGETRGRILETAKAHLRRFGYGKTTVVDIARELGMSHANVYRFFRSKTDLLDAIIEEWLDESEALMDEIVSRDAPATERLEALIAETHRLKRSKFETDPNVYEIYSRVMTGRPDLAKRNRRSRLKALARVIEDGIAAGEFHLTDPRAAAAIVNDATVKFHHPTIVAQSMNQPTEDQARAVLRALASGFAAH